MIDEGETTKEGEGKKRRAQVRDTNRWHREEREWLEQQLHFARDNKESVLVLTHHTPSFSRTSHPQHDGTSLSHAFSSNLDHLLQPPVAAWLFGHTHYNDVHERGDVLLASNQLGYFAKGERVNTFHCLHCVEISDSGAKFVWGDRL